MRDFFVEPRHTAGFHVLILYINVFNKPHIMAKSKAQSAERLKLNSFAFNQNALPYALCPMHHLPRRTQLCGKRSI